MTPNPSLRADRHARVLACVQCQRRKTKCDRNSPCSSCVKANVSCTPSSPAPSRKRRRPNQDLQERLARCEQLLQRYDENSMPIQPSTPAATFLNDNDEASPAASESYEKPTGPGRMVPQDGGPRFMDRQLWTSFYDELQAMKQIVETEDPEDMSVPGTECFTPDNNAELILPASPGSSSLEDLQPEPVQAFRLWQMFLDRVNPLMKIIHVPTLQPYVTQATGDMSSIPMNYQALLFAVYLMATISLSELECKQMLGTSRDNALHKFTAGTRLALIRFDLLRNYDMAALQAMLLFLISLQGRYDQHAAWILSGTIMRIAQKMGYHRDGEHLGLTPFETEMRRRIWWLVVMQDCKLAVLSGLSHSFVTNDFDTKQPQNLNDADLFVGSTEPVRSREGPTEMAFCLIINRLSDFVLDTGSRNGFEAAIVAQSATDEEVPAVDRQLDSEKYRQILRELDADLREIERRHIDTSAGRVHSAALYIRPMLVQKLIDMLIPMQEQPEWGTEIFGPKDNLFKIVLMNNENNCGPYEHMDDLGFLWFAKLHFQLDIFSVLTGQLSQRPIGSLSDRGWTVVERVYKYHDELMDMSQKHSASQAQFTLRAWKAREHAYISSGQAFETPSFVTKLRELVPQSQESRSTTQSVVGRPSTAQSLPNTQDTASTVFGRYLDVPGIDLDMWGTNMSLMSSADQNNQQMPAPYFGGISFGNMTDMGNMGGNMR